MTEWVRTYERGLDHLEALGGVHWFDAPLPRRRHQCQPQTRGFFGVNYVERCACGAYRESARLSWLNRNERREDRTPAARAFRLLFR